MRTGAVIFDCDGVLVDSETLAVRGERQALAAFGLNYKPAEYVRRFVGLHDNAFFDQLRADYLEKHGAKAPRRFEREVLIARRKERAALAMIDGADRALAAADALFAAKAVASSSRARFLEAKLKRVGLWSLARPHVYSADLVERGKPAPDIFVYAAQKMGVSPARCIVLEDSENGVAAGVAADMRVWGFVGGGHCYEGHGARLSAAGAERIFATFDGVVSAFC